VDHRNDRERDTGRWSAGACGRCLGTEALGNWALGNWAERSHGRV